MGNVGAVHVHPDLPSVASPGELSAWTDPIGTDLVDDVQEFFAELIEVCKDPILYNMSEQYYLKDLEIEGPSPDEFRVRVILDGAKLKKNIPWKQDEEDVCRVWYEVFADRNLLYMRTTEFDPETGKNKRVELHSMMHQNKEDNTIKVEIWSIDSNGVRRSGKVIAGLVEWIWVKPLLMCRFGQKVKVRSNIESYDSGGRVALTEPLDEFFNAQQFYEALVAQLRNEVTLFKAEVTDKSENEFDAEWNIEFPLPEAMHNAETGQTTWKLQIARNIMLDHDNRQIVIHERVFGELTKTSFFRIYNEPCRCEYWQMLPNGSRMGGGKEACEMRLKLIGLISEAEIRGEIEGLAANQENIMF